MSIKRLNTVLTTTLPALSLALAGSVSVASEELANAAFYQPVTALAYPAWYTPRINWMMNPQSMQPMFNMMNMGNYSAPVPAANNATIAPAN
jgi:hypothetical protein